MGQNRIQFLINLKVCIINRIRTKTENDRGLYSKDIRGDDLSPKRDLEQIFIQEPADLVADGTWSIIEPSGIGW